MKNRVKTPAELRAIRESGRMLGAVLKYLAPLAVPGITTKELDTKAAAELAALGGKPAFLGYEGFPGVICISVNEEVVHGIPGNRRLQEGDLVGLDFGVDYNGMITDGAVTVPVGRVTAPAQRLLVATEQALTEGIGAVRDGARVGDISAAVERRLRADKLGVVEDLCGHGVGHELHEDPIIPNFGQAGRGARLVSGMTLAIEPMATLGTHRVLVANDDWTIVTADGSLGAQFEHTVLVTDTGAEIITLA